MDSSCRLARLLRRVAVLVSLVGLFGILCLPLSAEPNVDEEVAFSIGRISVDFNSRPNVPPLKPASNSTAFLHYKSLLAETPNAELVVFNPDEHCRAPSLLVIGRPSLADPREALLMDFKLNLFSTESAEWLHFIHGWVADVMTRPWHAKDIFFHFSPTHDEEQTPIGFSAASRRFVKWYYEGLKEGPQNQRGGISRMALIVDEPRPNNTKSDIFVDYEGLDLVVPNGDYLFPILKSLPENRLSVKWRQPYDALGWQLMSGPRHSAHSPYLERQVAAATLVPYFAKNQWTNFGRWLEKFVREQNFVVLQFHHNFNQYLLDLVPQRRILPNKWLVWLLLLAIGPFLLDLELLVQYESPRLNGWVPLLSIPHFETIVNQLALGLLCVFTLATISYTTVTWWINHQVGKREMMELCLNSETAQAAQIAKHSIRILTGSTMLGLMLCVMGLERLIISREVPATQFQDDHGKEKSAPSVLRDKGEKEGIASSVLPKPEGEAVSNASTTSMTCTLDILRTFATALRLTTPLCIFVVAMLSPAYAMYVAPAIVITGFLSYFFHEVDTSKYQRQLTMGCFVAIAMMRHAIRNALLSLITRPLSVVYGDAFDAWSSSLFAKELSDPINLFHRILLGAVESYICLEGNLLPAILMGTIFFSLSVAVAMLTLGLKTRHITDLWFKRDNEADLIREAFEKAGMGIRDPTRLPVDTVVPTVHVETVLTPKASDSTTLNRRSPG